jgi:hypothetical protein
LRGAGFLTETALPAVSVTAQFDEVEYERFKRHCGRAARAPISREDVAAAAKKVEMATK